MSHVSDPDPCDDLIAVVAMTPRGVIGRDGTLPWRLRSDLRRFKERTMGGTLIMGRKTYESIGRPLPGRQTVVVTRQPDWSATGVTIANSPQQALDAIRQHPAFVVGGAEIYRQLLPHCGGVLLTRVLADLAGDTVVDLDLSDFDVVEQIDLPAAEGDQYATEFRHLVRRR